MQVNEVVVSRLIERPAATRYSLTTVRMAYVDLSRRFRDLTKDELEAPEVLAWLNDSSLKGSVGWTKLLEHPRVLLLAEAGSGKTMEMRAQAARLMDLGEPGFFVALESLDREPIEQQLGPRERQALEGWKQDGQSTAWFFLDAVDELKLVQGKLERALGRLANTVDGRLHRAHVVISCRPNDWRRVVDMDTVQAKLPIVAAQPIPASDSDEAFLAALREPGGGRQREVQKAGIVNAPRAVVLLPLNERQIVTLAQSLGIADTAALVAEIRRQDAWTFARRPLDVVELVTSWLANGRLGTRAEQHSANVTAKLTDDPDRRDRDVLSEERARSGAERLALALALTRRRTIRSPEQALAPDWAEGVLDPAEILTDWTPKERQTLLRRALFDPATYGRIRFHHRSVQEYLAARRLAELRGKGMSTKSLFRLIFAERYGVPLVMPSMQAIAAWLALWEDDVRRELMAREPETLLSMGDPESLPIPARAELLRAFAQLYCEGGRRGVRIPPDEIGRLAHAELAGVVRELWDARPSNPEVTELLLETIWLGPIGGCADIARAAAFDAAMSENCRVIAIKALAVGDRIDLLREVSDSVLREPTKWPGQIVQTIVGDVFPSALKIDELMALLRRAGEPTNTVPGFSWAMNQIAESIELPSDLAVELRDALADLIWQGRQAEQHWFDLKGRFDAVAPALARLCDRQLEAQASPAGLDARLMWACVVANRFTDHRAGVDDALTKLKKRFEVSPELREAAFRAELKLTFDAAPAEDARERCFHAEHESLIECLTAGDRPWLLEALRSSREPEHRAVVLHALLPLWRRHGRDQVELEELQAIVSDDPDLTEVLHQGATPPEPDTEHEDWELEQRQRKLAHEDRERQRVEGWLSWRKGMFADPAAAFTTEAKPTTTRNLYHWLAARHNSRTRYSAWDAIALREAFGDEITTRAEEAFRATWRAHSPTPWSQRRPEERNSLPVDWIEGLTGLAAEATTADWATHLAPDEARIAAAYATIELNGFPSWLKDLVVRHAAVVDDVIGAELTAELAATQEHSHLPTLQNLWHADLSIKRLLAPRLVAALPDWPVVFPDEECVRRSEHHLDSVLDILSEVIEGPEGGATVARLCGRQFFGSPSGPLALTWLKGLIRFDLEGATEALEAHLGSLPETERSGRAVAALASLFGDHARVVVAAEDGRRAGLLGRLVRCAYRHVRQAEDQRHEGGFTPNVRDRAETARNVLLSALLDTPGAEAQAVIRDLAMDPLFADFPDRLRFLARRRAASDSESKAFRPEDVVALEQRFEAPPHDRDGLFTVMVDRLDDLAHDVAHDDFTDRRTLRTLTEESEMQRTLARRLRDSARGAYVVSREEEVADRKKTDIRLAATHGEQKAVIEVKIARLWSLSELEHALRDQLVGRYLRDDTCKAGCLLLTYDGKERSWEHPEAGRLSFGEVIQHLQCSAAAIESERGYQVRLAVCAIDLSDPPLA